MTAPSTLADPTAAVEFFAAKLRFETDPSDVAAAFAAGDDFVLVDSRGHAPWHQGRIAGAIHMPHAEIPERAAERDPDHDAGRRLLLGSGVQRRVPAPLCSSASSATP